LREDLDPLVAAGFLADVLLADLPTRGGEPPGVFVAGFDMPLSSRNFLADGLRPRGW
jgi:hypothetical protein